VLLKDVLQHRLAAVAEVVDSTVGGVKAAVHRAQAKLRTPHAAPSQVELDGRQRKLLDAMSSASIDGTGRAFAI
jgi:hypothetical protein